MFSLGMVASRDRHSSIPARDPPEMSGVTMATRRWSGGSVNAASTLVRVKSTHGADQACSPEDIRMPAKA